MVELRWRFPLTAAAENRDDKTWMGVEQLYCLPAYFHQKHVTRQKQKEKAVRLL